MPLCPNGYTDSMNNQRRAFLKSLAGATLAASLPEPLSAADAKWDRLGELLPLRALGRTGRQVTLLGVGGWHIGRMRERDAQATIEAALEGGVRFFDTAEEYQGGGSEAYYGKLLTPKYRDVVCLMTKTTARDAAAARGHLDESLKRLATDYLDIWQVHAIGSAGDVDSRIAGGVLDVLKEAKASGKVRHLGFTGHTRPSAHRRMLERAGDLFDTVQMPVNAADPSYLSFTENVLPELMKRGIGVLAMKTLGNGGFFGGSQHGEHGPNPRLVPDRLSIREAVHFAWSLPISTLITGPDDLAQMKEKITLARSFAQMDPKQRKALVARVADRAGRTVEFYKAASD